MRLPDGSILMHDATHAYDPQKAHDYYVKTRKLKGRKPGKGLDGLAPQGLGLPQAKGPKKGLASVPKVDPKVKAVQRAAAVKRINALKDKLADLGNRLKERMAEAKKAEADAKKPATAAEKAKSARESAKYRDKNKQKIANKAKKAASEEKAPKKDTVESLQTEIAEVKGRLTAAVAKLRTLA